MELKSFCDSIQNLRREERPAAIKVQLALVWRECKLSAVDELLDRLTRIGRKWEELAFAVVQQMVSSESVDSELRAVLSAWLDHRLMFNLTFRDKETGIQSHELKYVLGSLSQIRPPKGTVPRLVVRFETPHAYVYGLCAIAAWVTNRGAQLHVAFETERTQNFLERAGVLDAISQPESNPLQFDTATILGFTRIEPRFGFDTDTHASRLVRLFQAHATLSAVGAQALSIAFSELIENAIKHGEIDSPAWLFANYHPLPRIMHVCICDCGIGIRESFRRSLEQQIRNLADDGSHWIKAASEPLVTSKTEGHAGYGLYLVRELCRRNGGQFVVLSGDAAYRLRPFNADSPTAESETLESLAYYWQGTLVAMQFHLDRPLELGPIYDTLPAPRGLDEPVPDVDLFDE